MEVYELEVGARTIGSRSCKGASSTLRRPTHAPAAAMDASFRKLTGRDARRAADAASSRAAASPCRRPRSAWRASPSPISARRRLGSLDYQRIAHSYHTLMIDEIPVLGPEQRNEARRLITLIDVLYDNGVGLIASAAAEPQALYVEGDRRRELRPHRVAAHGDALARPIWRSGIGGSVRASRAESRMHPSACTQARNCQ